MLPSLPLAVSSPHELIAILTQLVDITHGPQTVALIVDRHCRPVTAYQHPGDVGCADLINLCAICVDTAHGVNELLIIASWRSIPPDDDDCACWYAMLERTAASEIHLVDWLLVDDDDVTSMATKCGRP